MKIRLSQSTLQARLKWCGLSAVVVFVVLQLADAVLKAKTGAGVTDLLLAGSGPSARFIIDRWQSPTDAIWVGFGLGFGFLFILLYGLALHSGTILARERFAPAPGALRRLLDALSIAPIVAVLCDLAENTLCLTMLSNGPSEILATLTFQAAVIKGAAFIAGLLPTLAAAGALLIRRKPQG